MLLTLFLNNSTTSEIFRFTTLPYELSINVNTSTAVEYSPDHGIVTLEPPKTGNTLTKDSYTIKLADPNQRFAEYCSNAAGSSHIELHCGFCNVEDTPITSTNGFSIAPGEPIVDPPYAISQDVFLIYAGNIDAMQYVITEDSGFILEIRVASPIGVLDASNVFYTTAYNLQHFAGGVYDSAFDNVGIDSKKQGLLWGKID